MRAAQILATAGLLVLMACQNSTDPGELPGGGSGGPEGPGSSPPPAAPAPQGGENPGAPDPTCRMVTVPRAPGDDGDKTCR